MSFDSRVYRLLIASPSDVEEEREIAVRVIQEWNDLHSYTRKVVLLPLRWETHTAPDYGTRPQEVINRAIVDQCDLLVGIFWTRIGSPTGESESGTLEEIDRVAHAGKPVMLYFSKVGADPGELDLKQVARLQEFKEKTRPTALSESYKSLIDFRDKFAKQLELKVRDLQKADTVGPPPLLFSFVAPGDGRLVGSSMSVAAQLPVVQDLSAFASTIDKGSDYIEAIVDQAVNESVAVPAVLAIQNTSSFGVRDLYVAIDIKASTKIEVSRSLGKSRFSKIVYSYSSTLWDDEPSALEASVNKTLAHFEEEGLSKEGDDWKLTFEWGALQPQRMRLVKPVVFIVAKASTKLNFIARVFADGFPQPLEVIAKLEVTIEPVEAKVENLVPDIRERLARRVRSSDVVITTGDYGVT